MGHNKNAHGDESMSSYPNITSTIEMEFNAIISYIRYLLSCFCESGKVSIIISPSSKVKWWWVFSPNPL